MIDTQALKTKIRMCGYNVSAVAKMVGINKSTFYRRLQDNGEKFSISEVDRICTFLSLSKKDRESIFFNFKGAKMHQNEENN